jgi:hypothetical protein
MSLTVTEYTLLASCVVFASIAANAKSWPTTRPATTSIEVTDFRQASASLAIENTRGESIYKLVCLSGERTEKDFDYAGLIQCRLIDLGPNPVGPDLLNQPSATRDWLSRGKFEVSELKGNCAKDAYFGAKRIFQLRGMQIEIQVSDLREANTDQNAGRDAQVTYRLSLRATNNRNAKRATDSKVSLPKYENGLANCAKKEAW